MPANAAERLLHTAYYLHATEGVTEGDRLSIQNAWWIAGLSILIPVILFIIAERRYGARFRQERQERADEREETRLRGERAAERASWQQEFDEIRSYHRRAERVVDRIIAAPNQSRRDEDEDELKELVLDFEAVARRCPDDLVEDLQEVAGAIRQLQEVQLLGDTAVQEAYRQALEPGGSGALDPGAAASAIGARAISQYTAAARLRTELDDVWKALRAARGEV